jgi:hypothetical protein
MLPGFRFLLAAILLSVSILVFGLGAAALLRAAHEEFASNPSWRATREVRFAQAEETDRTTLAMLRIEPQADAAKMTDAPIGVTLAVTPSASAAPAAVEPPTPEAEEPPATATSSPIETAAVESPPAEASPSPDTAPVAATTDRAAVAEKVMTAATEEASAPQDAPSPVNAEATKPEQSTTPPAAEIAAPATRLASRGDQSTTVVETAKIGAKPERGATKPHPRAQHAKERHKPARARPAQQAAAVRLPPVFPLFEPQPLPPAAPPRER